MIVRLSKRALQPAIDHWQGRHAWPLTLIVSVLGATTMYSALLWQMPLTRPGVAIAIWITTGVLLLTWQITGTLRAVRASLSPPSEPWSVWGGYATVLVAVVFVGLKMLDGVVRHLPKPVPQAALRGNTYAVILDEAARLATIRGELNYASLAAITDHLTQRPKIRRLILDSAGGQIFAARAIADQIEKLGLDTHVDNRCFSACTIAFMAGRKRTLGPNGRLGFHRYAFQGRLQVETIDPLAEQQRDLAYFLSRGVSSDFTQRMFDAGHDHIWRPDPSVLIAASVITGVTR